jgi:hypothetical protein
VIHADEVMTIDINEIESQGIKFKAPDIEGYRFVYWTAEITENNKKGLILWNSQKESSIEFVGNDEIERSLSERNTFVAYYIQDNTGNLDLKLGSYGMEYEYTGWGEHPDGNQQEIPDELSGGTPNTGNKLYMLNMAVSWVAPEGYEVSAKGILGSDKELTDENFRVGAADVAEETIMQFKEIYIGNPDIGNADYMNGNKKIDEFYMEGGDPVWAPTILMAEEDLDKNKSYRAYITLTKTGTTETVTYYSNIVRGAFSSFDVFELSYYMN